MDDADGGGTPTKPARRYRGLDPEQRRADRRRRLLAAGLERFGTEGYQATTITGLCRTAGITTAHFYDEFDGREALLWAVFDDVVTTAAARVTAAITDAAPTMRERARAGLDAFVREMLEDPRRGRVQCLEVVGVSPEFESKRRDIMHAYARTVTEVAGTIAGTDQSMPQQSFTALALVAGVNDAVVEWLHREDPPPIDELVDELVELFVVVGEHAISS